MTTITVAATQFSCEQDIAGNIEKAKSAVREAAGCGANIVLLPELFTTPYFCQDQDPKYFALAEPFAENTILTTFSKLARELSVVLPVSFFERANAAHYNALAMIDADGRVVGHYRKSHIPDGPGYQEKYYFNPGDTGFRTWSTRYGTLGCGICWDQWFPETARILALKGAEILLHPTAIGNEPPPSPPLDSRDHWRRVMQGHAAANCMPLLASNRFGREIGASSENNFYGSSFIAGPTGEIIAELPRDREGVITTAFDLDAIRIARTAWGVFRDRRPDLYGPLLTLDGNS